MLCGGLSSGKTLREFVSSTFRDMRMEREHLAKGVFPELKQKCRERDAHLIDVDLRWGVKESDVNAGKVLDICLDEIDFCRPYFLGLLGERYGHIPPGDTRSITAQEVFHGILHDGIPRQVLDLRAILTGRLDGEPLTPGQANCLSRCYRWNSKRHKYLLAPGVSEEDRTIIRSVFKRSRAYQRNRSLFFSGKRG